MPHSHATELRVRYAETDRMGVVYYANYLVWCEVGRVEFLRALVSLEGVESSVSGTTVCWSQLSPVPKGAWAR